MQQETTILQQEQVLAETIREVGRLNLRVNHLLEANNRQLEKTRDAEREVRELEVERRALRRLIVEVGEAHEAEKSAIKSAMLLKLAQIDLEMTICGDTLKSGLDGSPLTNGRYQGFKMAQDIVVKRLKEVEAL